ncbi:hypothetical protein FJZ23_02270 [Candidatus Parcubacteria bacterium]|nr:hypothetical protein [Candidatus Parcubacteria bacterium]
MRLILRSIAFSLREVFQHARYVFFALSVAAVVMAVILWLPNYEFIRYAFASNTFDWPSRLTILFTTLGTFKTNFPFVSQIILPMVAALCGINVALLTFDIKRRLSTKGTAGLGLFGLLVSLFGIGCGACGSVLLSTFLGITSATALVAALPFDGAEFGLLGVVILLISTAQIAKTIHAPAVCALRVKS